MALGFELLQTLKSFDNVGGKVDGSLPVGAQSQNSEVDEKEV